MFIDHLTEASDPRYTLEYRTPPDEQGHHLTIELDISLDEPDRLTGLAPTPLEELAPLGCNPTRLSISFYKGTEYISGIWLGQGDEEVYIDGQESLQDYPVPGVSETSFELFEAIHYLRTAPSFTIADLQRNVMEPAIQHLRFAPSTLYETRETPDDQHGTVTYFSHVERNLSDLGQVDKRSLTVIDNSGRRYDYTQYPPHHISILVNGMDATSEATELPNADAILDLSRLILPILATKVRR